MCSKCIDVFFLSYIRCLVLVIKPCLFCYILLFLSSHTVCFASFYFILLLRTESPFCSSPSAFRNNLQFKHTPPVVWSLSKRMNCFMLVCCLVNQPQHDMRNGIWDQPVPIKFPHSLFTVQLICVFISFNCICVFMCLLLTWVTSPSHQCSP